MTNTPKNGGKIINLRPKTETPYVPSKGMVYVANFFLCWFVLMMILSVTLPVLWFTLWLMEKI